MAAEQSSPASTLVAPALPEATPQTATRRAATLRWAATILLVGALLIAPMVLSEFRLGLWRAS